MCPGAAPECVIIPNLLVIWRGAQMPSRPVTGGGPIAYLASTNKFYLIPLTALDFQDGKLSAARWYSAAGLTPANEKDRLEPYLAELLSLQQLRPGEVPAPVRAVTFRAVAPGAAGNSVQVGIAKVKLETGN